jgi:uncharacterized phage protein (TIGR02218 family)
VKTASVALKAHMARGTTTLAWCWKVTRTDGQVFGFTSVDKDLVIAGVTYAAATGVTPSQIESSADLSVPNLELQGFLDSEAITEEDLIAGKWDGAAVEIFEVNYADLTQGSMTLRAGVIGQVNAGALQFTAETRGLAQALQQPIGRVYAAACGANLGDARCTVDLGPFTVTGAVTSTTSRRNFADSSRTEADDWFGTGVVTWTSGANAGVSMEVGAFAASGGVFTLWLPMVADIAVGDTYSAVPGCRKRRTEDCKGKFNNVVNHRGFPDVPLNDLVIGNATAADAPDNA